MKYRVQKSDHQGIVNRAFGGRVASWGKWITVASFETLDDAQAKYDYASTRGLTRWRLIYGTEILRKSL